MPSMLADASQSEALIFKKKLAKLEQYKGRGTELISVYIPPATDRSAVTSQLNEELSQSSNIKSPQTRKNVQAALRKISGFLKQINFKLPETGIVVFSGNVSESEGRTDIRLFTVKPIKELKVRLYWCDSSFHLDPLRVMSAPQDYYGLLTVDKNESTLAILIGKRYEIIGKFTSGVAGKTRAGGQSSKRFEHLREEAAQEFYKRISEKTNAALLPLEDKLKGIIVGGPGITKNFFLEKDLVDYRLKKKIIGTIDTSYTDESGIRELIQRSEELLKHTALMKERMLISRFLEHVAKEGGLAEYGEKKVLEDLAIGKVDILLLSEELNWPVFRFECQTCKKVFDVVAKSLNYSPTKEKCSECASPQLEILEEIDYFDYMVEKASNTGAKVEIISNESEEGKQFLKSFDGIGALLRYR